MTVFICSLTVYMGSFFETVRESALIISLLYFIRISIRIFLFIFAGFFTFHIFLIPIYLIIPLIYFMISIPIDLKCDFERCINFILRCFYSFDCINLLSVVIYIFHLLSRVYYMLQLCRVVTCNNIVLVLIRLFNLFAIINHMRSFFETIFKSGLIILYLYFIKIFYIHSYKLQKYTKKRFLYD